MTKQAAMRKGLQQSNISYYRKRW